MFFLFYSSLKGLLKNFIFLQNTKTGSCVIKNETRPYLVVKSLLFFFFNACFAGSDGLLNLIVVIYFYITQTNRKCFHDLAQVQVLTPNCPQVVTTIKIFEFARNVVLLSSCQWLKHISVSSFTVQACHTHSGMRNSCQILMPVKNFFQDQDVLLLVYYGENVYMHHFKIRCLFIFWILFFKIPTQGS